MSTEYFELWRSIIKFPFHVKSRLRGGSFHSVIAASEERRAMGDYIFKAPRVLYWDLGFSVECFIQAV